MRKVVALLIFLLVSLPLQAVENSREGLNEDFDNMLALLRKDDTESAKEFFEKHSNLAETASKFTQAFTIRKFNGEKRAKITNLIESIRNKEATLDQSTSTYTFVVPENLNARNDKVTFSYNEENKSFVLGP